MTIASSAVVKQESLEAAVASEVNTGVRDPVEIIARLSERHGQAWLLRQLVNVVARIVAGGAAVRSAPSGRAAACPRTPARSPAREDEKPRGRTRVEKAAGDVAGDFFASSRWVSPEVGWRRVLDLTADDCRAIAAQLETISDVASRHRRWFDDAAAAIEHEGAATLGDVKRPLIAPAGALPAGAATM